MKNFLRENPAAAPGIATRIENWAVKKWIEVETMRASLATGLALGG